MTPGPSEGGFLPNAFSPGIDGPMTGDWIFGPARQQPPQHVCRPTLAMFPSESQYGLSRSNQCPWGVMLQPCSVVCLQPWLELMRQVIGR